MARRRSRSSRLETYRPKPPRVSGRPRAPVEGRQEPVETLRGEIRGQPASDIEERLYNALVRSYGYNKVEFQPTLIGTRNVLGEIRPDFVVDSGVSLRIYFADGEYAHKSAEQRDKDAMQDKVLFHQLRGIAEFPIRIPGDDLQTQEDADEAVDNAPG